MKVVSKVYNALNYFVRRPDMGMIVLAFASVMFPAGLVIMLWSDNKGNDALTLWGGIFTVLGLLTIIASIIFAIREYYTDKIDRRNDVQSILKAINKLTKTIKDSTNKGGD